MEESKIRQLIKEEITNAAKTAQYSVTRVPVHTHNNLDAPNLPQLSVNGFEVLPGTPNGVANPKLLNGQALTLGDAIVSTVAQEYANIYSYPLPVVYGYGTTDTLTLTGVVSAGAVSATLTGAYGGTTGQYAVQFDSDEVRIATLTASSTAIVWTPALTTGAGVNVTQINNARFHGGEAVSGTALIFRNDDDGILQLWVRTDPGTFTNAWASVSLTLSVIT